MAYHVELICDICESQKQIEQNQYINGSSRPDIVEKDFKEMDGQHDQMPWNRQCKRHLPEHDNQMLYTSVYNHWKQGHKY